VVDGQYIGDVKADSWYLALTVLTKKGVTEPVESKVTLKPVTHEFAK